MFKHFSPGKIFVLAVMITFISCANYLTMKGYSGEVLPDSEVAKISLPPEVNLFAVNGQSTEDNAAVWLGAKSKLQLLPGSHDLTLRYSSLWDNDPFGITKIRSKPVKATIEVKAGEEYEIRPDRRIINIKDAGDFAATPVFKIIKIGGTKEHARALTSKIVERPQLPLDAPKASLGTPDPQQETSSVRDLKQSWNNASEEEREELIRSIVKE